MDLVSLKSDPESAGKHLGVACETCHGPARDHVAFNKRLINVTIGRDLELAARETIRKSKPTAACIQCHLREAHKKHPEFELAAVEGGENMVRLSMMQLMLNRLTPKAPLPDFEYRSK